MTKQELPSDSASLEEDFLGALQGVRAALTELFDSVGADPARPQAVSRRFGLSRNLAWRVTRVMTRTDPAASLPHLPASAGMGRVLAAFEREGAPAEVLARTRRALADFNRVVALHAGDRATLARVIGALVPDAEGTDLLEQSRRQAFLGNSGIWGVEARVQLAVYLVAPSSSDPRAVDLIQVGGLVDFKRLRPDVRWPLFRRHVFHGPDAGPKAPRERALDPARAEDEAPLLAEFCSDPAPSLEVVSLGREERYRLPAGPIGNTAVETCFYGKRLDAVGHRSRTGEDVRAEIGVNLSTPAEWLQFDLLLHEDLDWGPPSATIYSRLEGDLVTGEAERELNRVPIAEPVRELGRGLASTATTRVPRYAALMRRAFDLAGWDPDRFRGSRLELRYPPVPTTALFACELPG